MGSAVGGSLAKQTVSGVQRLTKAWRFSWQGIQACYQHEEAFRQEVWLTLIGIPLALWLGDGLLEKALMLSVLLLLMIVELLNSAIENVVDRIGEEHHALSGRAKDMGSAAVLLASLLAGILWLACLFN